MIKKYISFYVYQRPYHKLSLVLSRIYSGVEDEKIEYYSASHEKYGWWIAGQWMGKTLKEAYLFALTFEFEDFLSRPPGPDDYEGIIGNNS
jgi:hypothetical protein